MRTLPWFKGWFTPNKIEVSNQPLDVDLLIDKILSNDIFKEMITASSSGMCSICDVQSFLGFFPKIKGFRVSYKPFINENGGLKVQIKYL